MSHYFELWYPHRKHSRILRPSFAENKERKSHIKDTTDFLDKLNDLREMLEVALLLLYPSIPNDEYLKVLPKQYEKFLKKKVHTENIVN